MKLVNRNVLNAAVGSTTALVAVIVACLLVAGNDAPALQPAALTEAPRSSGQAVVEASVPSGQTTGSRAVSEADHQELLRKVERLEALLADSPRSESRSEVDEPADGGDEDESFSPEAEDEKVLAQFRAQVEMLETALHTEFVDEDWAKPAMIALREAFESQAAEGIEMLELDCRGTMCRLGLTFDPALAEESFRNLPSIIPWEGEVFFQLEDVDSGRAVVYIARNEEQLPRAE